MAADLERVGMLQADTPEWRLWAAIAELASYLTADQWVLIGGQMVALHLRMQDRSRQNEPEAGTVGRR